MAIIKIPCSGIKEGILILKPVTHTCMWKKISEKWKLDQGY